MRRARACAAAPSPANIPGSVGGGAMRLGTTPPFWKTSAPAPPTTRASSDSPVFALRRCTSTGGSARKRWRACPSMSSRRKSRLVRVRPCAMRDARCLGGRAGRRGDFTPSAAWLLAGHGAQHRRLGPLGPDQQRARGGGRLHAPRTLLLALALASNPSAWLSFVRDAQGRRGFTKRSAQTLAVLHFSARDPLRSIIQNSHFECRAEAL